jgi:hypothetical protein
MFAASGLILASPGSVKAAACNTGGPGTTTGYSIVQLQAAAFSCDIEDLTYSEFEFNHSTLNPNKIKTGSYTFGYDGTGGYTFGTSGLSYTATGFDYRYKVALKSPIRPGQAFESYDTGFTATPKTPGGPYTFKKELSAFDGANQLTGGTLNSNPALVAAKVTAQNKTVASGASTFSVVTSDGDYFFKQPQVTAIVFKDVVAHSASGGNFTGFTDYIQLTKYETPPTPGPLPILGAAAAFSFSRQLRRRIKLA